MLSTQPSLLKSNYTHLALLVITHKQHHRDVSGVTWTTASVCELTASEDGLMVVEVMDSGTDLGSVLYINPNPTETWDQWSTVTLTLRRPGISGLQ